MDEEKKDPESQTAVSEIYNPAEAGKKAIEANKSINLADKSKEEKDEIEKKDAEQWRNEG